MEKKDLSLKYEIWSKPTSELSEEEINSINDNREGYEEACKNYKLLSERQKRMLKPWRKYIPEELVYANEEPMDMPTLMESLKNHTSTEPLMLHVFEERGEFFADVSGYGERDDHISIMSDQIPFTDNNYTLRQKNMNLSLQEGPNGTIIERDDERSRPIYIYQLKTREGNNIKPSPKTFN